MAEEILASVQVRRDSKANWEAANPVLLDGEAAYEKDTDMFKIGDGVKHYSDLPYHNKVGPQGPQGETGATPQISVQAVTGEPGSEAQASISGTAEEPVITLTIPRGDPGDIGALTINGKSPDAAGSVTLSASDVGAAAVRFYSVSFPASGWEAQEGGGYAQQAAVDGITESMHGHVDVDMSAVTAENAADLQAAWAMIGRAESLDGALRLTAYADAPTVDITVNLEVIA